MKKESMIKVIKLRVESARLNELYYLDKYGSESAKYK